MSDLMNIGSSALLAYRSALDTVGHNIANANTAGYTRQRVDLQARAPTRVGDGWLGSGVEIGSVTRLTDQFVAARVVESNASYARIQTFQGLASRVDSLLSGSDTGLTAPLQSFFSAANALASDPSSAAARQAFLAAGDGVSARFNDLQQQFDTLATDINGRLSSAVDDVNGYAKQIADLNNEIALAKANGSAASDLLDQRDQALNALAQRIGVTTFQEQDGTLSVFTGGGQTLVLGKSAQTLALGNDEYNSGSTRLLLGNSRIDITAQSSGGSIGGLLDARSQLLDPLRSQLGRIAVGFVQSLNAQNAQGVDQSGALGGDLFALPKVGLLPASGTSTGASISASYADVSALSGDDYVLRYDGSAWSLSNAKTGAALPMTGSGTASDPYVAAGLSFTVSGSATAGDHYLVQPLRNAAGQVQLATQDPAAIAAAAPLRSSAAASNAGSASIGTPSVLDSRNAALLGTVSIAFTSATTYSINGSGSYPYSAGGNIDLNGWRVQIKGTPAAGDSFSVQATGANSGGNGNALQFAALANAGVLDGGRNSLSASSAALVAKAGGIAQQATLRQEAQAAIQSQTQAERDSLSGVNLDEEAADLVRYQQAYQAAARIIQVANELFQSLLDAAR